MGTASLTSNLLLLISLFCREFDLWLFCCILCLACVVRNLIFGTFQSVQNELWHFYTAGRQVLANGDAFVYGDVDADGQTDWDGKGNGEQSKGGKIVHKQIEAHTKGQSQKQQNLAPKAFVANAAGYFALDLGFCQAGG